jgi:hypothetical protein
LGERIDTVLVSATVDVRDAVADPELLVDNGLAGVRLFPDPLTL